MFKALYSRLRPRRKSKTEKALTQNAVQQETGINPGKFVGPVEKPRTANKAFGGISDFMLFFENRNPEMKKFAKEFKEIEKMDSEVSIEALNKSIAPKIDQCLTEMHKKLGTKLKNKYAGLFTITFETWEQFYKKILYAYTIAGFLYEKMNEFLRNEDWEKLDDLLLYTYSLFKAFLWESTAVEFSKTFEFLKSTSNGNKLILYRGADFDDISLRFYDTNQIKYFSWNGVTSTSLDVTVARGFQNGSSTKTPVLITVEIDFDNLNPQDLNALYLEGVSQHPKEREVALPPGSIFELLNKSEEKESEVEIKLKLVTDPKILARKGEFMHGMLQAVMGEEDELKVVCLKDKELSRAIKHCKGNQLISRLEFSLCSFNEHSVRFFQEVLPTMKNLTSFMLNSIEVEEDFCFEKIIKCLGNLNITRLEITNSIKNESEFRSLIEQIQYFGLLKIFKLSFQHNHWMNDHLLGELNNQASQYLDPQCIFECNMTNVYDIIVKGLTMNNFLGHIGEDFKKKLWIKENAINLVGTKTQLGFSFIGKDYKTSLKSTLLEALKHEVKPCKILSLSFDGCKNINDNNIKSLGWEDFQSLLHLNLDFTACKGINNKALKILGFDVIRQLPGLNSLSLCFDNCINITNKGLKRLVCHGIQHLLFLTILKLSFNGCKAITNKGLRCFSRLEEIKSLSLSFKHCKEITDKGFKTFLDPINFQFLTSIDLNFSNCSSVTDKSLKMLSHKILQNLKKPLTALSLKFDDCNRITDEGLIILFCQGINNLDSLQNLYLSFENSGTRNYQITDKGLSSLERFINNSSSLKHLHLNFGSCGKITSNVLRRFCFPKKLITLCLNFNNCRRIDDTVFQGLSLSHLTSLEYLYLNFQNFETIFDQDFQVLCSQGIKHLKKLKRLHLDFLIDLKTPGVTDKGLSSLGSDAIRHLPEIKTLYLDLKGHHQITHRGLKNLCTHLKNKLTDLHLGFSGTTDQGLEAFNFQENSLETLSLTFYSGFGLSNKGLTKFWREGIRSLSKLKNLSLRFESCWEITDEGLKDMCNQGIRYLTSLVSLNLTFSYCKNLSENQIFLIESQIDRLKLPQLQLPIEIIHTEYQLKISSRRSYPTGSVLCQDMFEFLPNKVESQQNIRESLTLRFEVADLNIFKSICTLKSFKDLKSLHLTFDECVQVTNFTLHKLCSQGIQHLELLNSLSLSFAECDQITDRGLKILGNTGIKHLKSLVSLSLNFDGCKKISNKGLNKLCDSGIRPLISLKLLCLSFRFCDKITNKGVKRLYHKGIKSLTSFFIDFPEVKLTERLKRQLSQSSSSSCVIISQDKPESTMSASRLQRHVDGILEKDFGEIGITNTMFTQYMSRKHYELHAHEDEIEPTENLLTSPQKDIIPFLLLSSDTKLPKRFINQELTYWHSLASLHLVLEKWRKYVTDSALNTLSTEVFQHLKSLTTLHLNFNSCHEITDSGLKHLTTQGINHLKSSLTSLQLDFNGCTQITDIGLQSLWTDGILCLRLLTTLDLSFYQCHNITGKCLKSSLKGVKNVTSLALSFEGCRNFEDVSFQKFCFEVVQNLKNLKILHLNLYGCQISHSGLQYLSLQKKSLSALSLSLDDYLSPTNQGIQSLILKSTTALHLTLGRCSNIALNLKFFNSLKSLHLNFQGSLDVITDQSLKDLCEAGLKHLVSLDVLGLCFGSCKKITDEGVQTLCCNGLQFMKELTTLYLSFSRCGKITEKGLETLYNDGIKYLDSLTNLHLCFSSCLEISSDQLSSLMNQINLLPLPHLQRPLKLDNSDCISSDPLLKCDQKLRNQKIMNTMIQKSKNISQRGTPENLNEAPSVLFNEIQNIANNLRNILEKNQLDAVDTLAKLHFDFEIFGRINKDGFHPKGVQNLVEVTKLRLNLKNKAETGKNLYQWICNLKQLKALYLNLSNSTYRKVGLFTDEGLRNFEQLEILHVNLNRCDRISDSELAALCSNGIQNLKKLRTLYLNFDGCGQLTDEALKSVLKGILKLSSIENLELSFLNCPRIPPSSYQAFLKILSYFGYVRTDQTSHYSKYLEYKESKWQAELKRFKKSKRPKILGR